MKNTFPKLPYNHKSCNKLVTEHDISSILNRVSPIGDNETSLYPRDLSIYQRSFVTTSFMISPDETLSFRSGDNEQLEFLGDSFLGAVVARYLKLRYPEQDEGFLTKLRTRLVRSAQCEHFARFLCLGKWLLLSPEMEAQTYLGPNKGRNNPRIYEDCFEAFIGAIIEDFGDEDGYRFVKRFVVGIIEHLVDFTDLILCNENHKDTLQRYFQAQKWPNPTFTDLDESGPSHTRTFTKGVFLKKEFLEHFDNAIQQDVLDFDKKWNKMDDTTSVLVATGRGNKKGMADQACSREALVRLRISLNF